MIWRPEHAEALVLRGVRLARRRGAHCYVLGLSQPGQAPVVLPEQAAEAAIAAGATMLERDSRDASAAIMSAVQETGVRHIVLPAPSAGLFERWRGTLVERLAGQLPDVHLHVQAGSAATMPEPGTAAGARGAPPSSGAVPSGSTSVTRAAAARRPRCWRRRSDASRGARTS